MATRKKQSAAGNTTGKMQPAGPTGGDRPIASRIRMLLSGQQAAASGEPSPLRKEVVANEGRRLAGRRTAQAIEAAVAGKPNGVGSAPRKRSGRDRPAPPGSTELEVTSRVAGINGIARAADNLERLLPRDEMLEALAHSTHPMARTMAAYLMDPEHAGKSLWMLCQLAELSPMQLLVAFRDYRLAEGLVRIANRAPKILEDVARDAESARIPCPQCYGDKVVAGVDGDDIPCVACFGTGELVRPGDKDARGLIFETMGLTKGGGLSINNNTTVVNNPPARTALPPMTDFIVSFERADTSKILEAQIVDKKGQE